MPFTGSARTPAARGHGFRQGGLTLGQVFLITPIRARAQGALRRHLACPHMGRVISPYPRPRLRLFFTIEGRRQGLTNSPETGLPLESDPGSCMGKLTPRLAPNPQTSAGGLWLGNSQEPLLHSEEKPVGY